MGCTYVVHFFSALCFARSRPPDIGNQTKHKNVDTFCTPLSLHRVMTACRSVSHSAGLLFGWVALVSAMDSLVPFYCSHGIALVFAGNGVGWSDLPGGRYLVWFSLLGSGFGMEHAHTWERFSAGVQLVDPRFTFNFPLHPLPLPAPDHSIRLGFVVMLAFSCRSALYMLVLPSLPTLPAA